MTDWLPITYREFWDVPRIFFVPFDAQTYLFDCAFDEGTEDYPDQYEVFLMTRLTDEQMAGSWERIREKATRKLGTVPVSTVQFDPTRRKEIRSDIFDRLMPVTPSANGAPQHADPPAAPVS